MNLAGKVALVTGAGQGIGRAIALKLAALEADLALVDLNPATVQETAAEIEKLGRRALALQADVSRKPEVDQAVQRVLEVFGRVDILVNNAGWTKYTPFLQETEEYWDRVMAVNLKGTILCSRAVLEAMIKQGGGKIINIASDAGRVGAANEAVYSACKAGVIGFTRALAREIAGHNIRVNCVSPGTTDTPLVHQMFTPEELAKRTRPIPLGRLGQPEDIAAAVAFFASDAADYITGQVLSVSGGITMAS